VFDATAPLDAVALPDVARPPEASVPDRVAPPADAADAPIDTGRSQDALAEVRDAPGATPDCRCPQDDYFVDADLNGVEVRLSSPFHIGLYCDETAPQLANPPCGATLRLSACAGPQNTPPCLYVAVDGRTPIVGLFLDATGQTFELVTGEVTLDAATGRLAIGTFSATYAGRTSEASVTAVGTFHACTTLFQPCRT